MILNNTFANAAAVINPTTATPAAPAWALFGTTYDKPVTIDEVFEDDKTGLNYEVTEQPIVRVPQSVIDAIRAGEPFNWEPNQNTIIDTHKATVYGTDGATLGVVGQSYGVVQNRKAMEFINFIEECSGHKPEIVAAGYLGKGERMFVTARLGEDVYIGKDDAVTNYVVFTNSHDGSGSVTAMLTPIRVVCQNTLNMALKQTANKLSFRHTSKVEERLDFQIAANRERAAAVFKQYNVFTEQFIAAMLDLKDQDVTKADTMEFAARMFMSPAQLKLWNLAGRDMDKVDEIPTRMKNNVNALLSAIESGIGQAQHRGTKLWLLNGLTTYLHNERKWSTPQDEYKSLMEGDGLKKVQKAYEWLKAA